MMLNQCLLYWIHSDLETNIQSQGYVGITKNLKRRLKEHARKKNFLDDRTVDIYLQGETEFCKKIEMELRPTRNIGLNKAAGGGLPPNPFGKKLTKEHKQKIKENMVGFKGRKHSEETKAKMRKAVRKSHPQTEETRNKIRRTVLAKKAEELKKFVDAA
tara:strand:+ start:485 stop:961 length:477 start_codon:yes stop_codon:yes gene_type:complete